MPGFVVNTGSLVTCTHQGKALPSSVVPTVLIMGQPVVTRAGPWQVAGCALPPPPAANGPCVSAIFSTSATRVTVFGVPILLQDSFSICAPSGTPLLITATQTRVFAI